MNRKIILSLSSWLACLYLMTLSFPAAAAPVYVYVDDMSRLKYQLTFDGRVYFRNLNLFNPSVTGCCYAFYMDTTTPYGKSAWATILMKIAARESLYLHVSESNPPTSGNPSLMDHLGNW